jgi:aldose 1-epimerase
MIDLTNGVCFRHGKLSANMACAFAAAAALAVAMTGRTAIAAATLAHALYGTTQDRQAVDIFTMTNEHGLRVRFLSLGGVITEIDVPDRTGRLDNIALGLRTLQEYETLPGHFGGITAAMPTASAVRSSP